MPTKAISVDKLLKMKFKALPFSNEWRESFGTPELRGAWIIFGPSGHGKTRFTLQLIKYLSGFGKAAYNSLEEGAKLSFQKAVQESGLIACGKKVLILSGENKEELKDRLRQPRAPKIVVIDSVQYFDITVLEFKELIDEFEDTLFIFISHADGKHPKGAVADAIRYHSDVKVKVEGYRAFVTSRYGGGEPFTIWHEGAVKYWGNF